MKLVSSVPFHPEMIERLRAISPGLEARAEGYIRSKDDFAKLVGPDTDIVYAVRVPTDLLELAPDLKWLQLQSAGCNHLAGHPVMDSDIPMTTCSGIHATPIAEYALATMLAFYRWLPQTFRAQMRREWLTQAEVSRGSRELRGRTIGIIGYGSIGREVARLAKPFGTRILALKRDPAVAAESGVYSVPGTGDPDGELPERFYSPSELHKMLPECDVVLLSVPLTEETRGLFGAPELALMHDRSYLINISRGEVVDESALTEALKSNRIAGAALDVFEREPLPADSELWGMDNVIVTPHISGGSRSYQRRAFEVLAENLRRFTAGEPMLNLVDRKLGY